MIDYQHAVSPPTALPYRQQLPVSQPAAYSQPQAQDIYPTTSPPNFPHSQFSSSHRHTRSASSSALPYSAQASSPAPISYTTAQMNTPQTHSRKSSSGVYSTSASAANNMSMHRQGTTGSTTSAPRRSTSSRSSNTTPTSYVALMRKQKATVWCDRSQNIDQRMAAAQRAAKQRAAQEVQSGAGPGRTSTINSGGVVGKIRHGGVPKAPGYVPANLSGAGVPARLSQNETLGEEEGQSTGDNSMVHARTGSGRSSTNSARYRSGYPRPDPGRFNAGGTPPGGAEGGGSPQEGTTELIERPGIAPANSIGNRKEQVEGRSLYGGSNALQQNFENEDSFGNLAEMKGPSSVRQAAEQATKGDDLKRRGSVDERAMTMSTSIKLFVANPDPDKEDIS